MGRYSRYLLLLGLGTGLGRRTTAMRRTKIEAMISSTHYGLQPPWHTLQHNGSACLQDVAANWCSGGFAAPVLPKGPRGHDFVGIIGQLIRDDPYGPHVDGCAVLYQFALGSEIMNAASAA